MRLLPDIQGFVIDMDGVLVRGKSALPGVIDFFTWLEKHAKPFIIATNNATTSPQMLSERLSGLGVLVRSDQVITSGEAAAGFLKVRLHRGAHVYVVGEQPLHMAMRSAGFTLTPDAAEAQAVVIGLDRKVTWEKLTEATLAVQAGALFIGTNPDLSLPIERGFAIGTGALLAAVTAVTGVSPIIIGKPEPHLFNQALQRMGTTPEYSLALGDRLETDILGAKNAGMPTVLLLTGVTSRQDLEDSELQPDWVFQNLTELTQALEMEAA